MRIWKETVGALPPTWLDAAARQILVRAVVQAGVCESLEGKLRELRQQPNPDLEALGSLAARHAASAKSLSQLLGVLRATPRARTREGRHGRSRRWHASARGRLPPMTKRARQRASVRHGERPRGREVIAFIEKFLRIPDGPSPDSR